MAIGFSNIPADIRVPLFYAEMDNSAANSASSAMRRLIVGQVNDDADSESIGKLVLVSSIAIAKSIGGQGSMLAAMYETWRKADRSVRSGVCLCKTKPVNRLRRK